jgi:hypothetical protein
VAGNPAREIRRRFDDTTVEALLKSEWWTFDEDRLTRVAALFTKPEEFLKKEGC